MRIHNVRGKKFSVILCISLLLISFSAIFLELGSASSATTRKVADIADGFETDVFIIGTTAFVACGWGGLKAYDITDPNEPEFQGEYDEGFDFQSVWVVGDYAYVAAGLDGFFIIDVSDLDAMEIASQYIIPNSDEMALEVEIDGDYAFLAYLDGGLIIFDISNPYNPHFISDYDWVGVVYTEIDVNGSYVYAANIYNGKFEVIDISNIYNPTKIGSYKDDVDYNHIYDICVVGDVGTCLKF